MSSEKVDIIRRSLEAWSRADFEAYAAFAQPEAERIPASFGVRRAAQAARRRM